MYFAIKLKKMRETTKKELYHIPRGDEDQNTLRMLYWGLRMNSLKEKCKTKKDVLKECIELVKKDSSGFEPKYDETYFKNVEAKA